MQRACLNWFTRYIYEIKASATKLPINNGDCDITIKRLWYYNVHKNVVKYLHAFLRWTGELSPPWKISEHVESRGTERWFTKQKR